MVFLFTSICFEDVHLQFSITIEFNLHTHSISPMLQKGSSVLQFTKGFQFCFGFALCLQIFSYFTHCTTLSAFSRPSIPMFIVCRNQTYDNRNQTEELGWLHGYSLVKSNIYFFCFPNFPSPCLSPFRMILLGLGKEQRAGHLLRLLLIHILSHRPSRSDP